ncbi:hypothetical protein C8Q76DRAFT_607980, partial [Earliella scabrosa]
MGVAFPHPCSYAAIQVDPVASVAHLNDENALAAARALYSRTYLVYIDHSLPFPGRPWYGFTVRPVGTSLRTPEVKDCITEDMCTPIFPNQRHPSNREPLHTRPAFPYSNCYHWFSPELDVRVHARPEGFDTDRAIVL